jgi:hypothetical protein
MYNFKMIRVNPNIWISFIKYIKKSLKMP